MTSLVLKTGHIGSDGYTLQRRMVLQNTRRSVLHVIQDEFGDLYAFHDLQTAEWHWRDMGIRSLAQQEAA